MKSFKKMTSCDSYQILKKLKPHDFLEKPLTVERVIEKKLHLEGVALYYGCERVCHAHLEALKGLAKEQGAFSRFKKTLSGEVMNFIEGFPSENRTVLHTAMRDVFPDRFLPDVGPLAIKAREAAIKELHKLEAFCKKESWIRDIVVIGIGGSYLGTQAIAEALYFHRLEDRRIFFVANIDPDEPARVLSEIDPSKTLVCVISKSGSTLETLANEKFFREEFQKRGVSDQGHFVAVTGEKSPLDNPKRYLESFYMWDFVGGRYSVTSMVGAVPLALLCGFTHFKEFLRGANAIDFHALTEDDPLKNMPMMMALLSIYRRVLGMDTLAMLPYSSLLHKFPEHLQQLHMESLGKSITQQGEKVDYITGVVHFGVPGTNGQHSFYQQLHQGSVKTGIDFVGFSVKTGGVDHKIEGTTSHEKLLANLFAQMVALANGEKSDNPNERFEGNRGSITLLFPEVTPYSVGQLLALYELKTMFEGYILNVNAFDQPGVQLGKRLANDCLKVMQGSKSKDGLFELLIEGAQAIAPKGSPKKRSAA